MSCVLVETGQCGNQLGYNLLDKLFSQFSSHSSDLSNSNNTIRATDVNEKQREVFFRQSGNKRKSKYTARAVCIDTEPKVINDCVSRANINKKWFFDTKSTSYLHGGAGNNWAQGYEMCSGVFLTDSMECIRRELEECDYSPFLLLTHSLAGGTGSGLGTRLTEAMAEEFSEVIRVNLAITPFHFSEVVVQNYNAVLSLAKIQAASDGVILYENETAQYLCKQARGIERPTLNDINDIIASHVLPILLPKYNAKDIHTNEMNKHYVSDEYTLLSDDIRHLCQHSGYKLLDIKTVPQTYKQSIDYTFDSWHSLITNINKMQTKGSFSERGLHINNTSTNSNNHHNDYCKSIASVLTLHGVDAFDALNNIQTNSDTDQTGEGEGGGGVVSMNSNNNNRFTRSSPIATSSSSSSLYYTAPHASHLLYTSPPSVISHHNHNHSFSPHSMDTTATRCYATCHPVRVNGYQRSVSLLSNSNSILPFLNRVTERAAELYHHRAYVHQYSMYGVNDEDFINAFRQVGQVIANYNSI